MALTKNQNNEIAKRKITNEFDSFKLAMHQRFDKTGEGINKAEKQISDKLDEIKQIILRRRAWYRNTCKEDPWL